MKKYLPYCLFSQAGVAIGLSILAEQNLGSTIGGTVVAVITATTFVVQIIGPSAVKFAVARSGEAGRNITEDKLIESIKVRDVMFSDVPVLSEASVLSEIIEAFSKGPHLWFPVLGEGKTIVGIVSVTHIKDVLLCSDLGTLLLAHDLMEPVVAHIGENMSLGDAKRLMRDRCMEYLPVLDASEKFVGIIEHRAIEPAVSQKLAALCEQA